jgi:hypothetical protein
MTAAATASSTWLLADLMMLVVRNTCQEAKRMPAIPAVRAKHQVRTEGRLTPARRAASGLPPMAYL